MTVPSLLRHFMVMAVFICLLPGAGRAADEPIGSVTKIVPPVWAQRADGSTVACQTGLPLFAGDTLTTGENGRVWFQLQGNRQFLLHSEAEMTIDELSFADEEQTPVLNLTLGFLWSKIAKIRDRLAPLTIHTPTAVCGVRGTEFETVVALDTATAVTVDEGNVQIEGQDKEVTLNPGEMIEVEPEVEIGAVRPAVAKDKRDWAAWRQEREDKLVRNLARLVPRLRKRLEQAGDKAVIFASGVRSATAELRSVMKEAGRAVQDNDQRKIIRARKKLWYHMRKFRKKADFFRNEANRVAVLNKSGQRLATFMAGHRDRFSARDLAAMEADLRAMAAKRAELNGPLVETGLDIKRTFRRYRTLKAEMNQSR